MRSHLVAVLVLAGLAGCNLLQGEGSATVTGTDAFSPLSALSNSVDGGIGVAIILTDESQTCADVKSQGDVQIISSGLVIAAVPIGTNQVGTYAVCSGVASADGGVCGLGGDTVGVADVGLKTGNGSVTSATAGSVTVTTASSSQVVGSFSVTIVNSTGSPGTMSGTFTAPTCSSLP